MPGAQEGRDAVRTHEAYLQTRSTPTTRLEWRQGRGAADRNGTELEAVGQIPLSRAASASNMRGVSVGWLCQFLERGKQSQRSKLNEWPLRYDRVLQQNPPKATELLRRREMTRCAISDRMHCSKTA